MTASPPPSSDPRHTTTPTPSEPETVVHRPYATPGSKYPGPTIAPDWYRPLPVDAVALQPSVLRAMRLCMSVHYRAGDSPDRLSARWVLLGGIVNVFRDQRGSIASERIQNIVSRTFRPEYDAVVGRRGKKPRALWNDFVRACAPVVLLTAEDRPTLLSGEPSAMFLVVLECRDGAVWRRADETVAVWIAERNALYAALIGRACEALTRSETVGDSDDPPPVSVSIDSLWRSASDTNTPPMRGAFAKAVRQFCRAHPDRFRYLCPVPLASCGSVLVLRPSPSTDTEPAPRP